MILKNNTLLISRYFLLFFALFIFSCENDDVRQVTLYDKGFTEAEASSTSIKFGQSVDFTSTSLKSVTTNWTFTGGVPSSSINPNVKVAYNTPGTFEAKLVVKYIDNTIDTKIFTIVVAGIDTPLPYNGTPVDLEGTIEAENYNLGGQDVGYNDNEEANLAVNNGSATYRQDDGVDIQVGPNATYISNTNAGEWVNYTVNVLETGNYNFEFRVASASATGGKSIRLQSMNQSTGAITNIGETGSFANTGGWDVFTSKTISNVILQGGLNTLRVYFTGGETNLDKINVTAVGPVLPINGLKVFSERDITASNLGQPPVNNGNFVITNLTSDAYEGVRAYRYRFDPTNSGNNVVGFALSVMSPATSPLNAMAYNYYNIALRTTSTNNLRVRMNTSAGNYWITLNSTTDALYGMARDGAWHSLKIPMADFKLGGNGAAITPNRDKITDCLVIRTDDADYPTYLSTPATYTWDVDDVFYSVD